MIVAGLELGRLLSLELRRALVEKRANSLAAVFRQITLNLLLHLLLKSLREFFLLAPEEGPFYRPYGQGRP
jgi:hypothetical protein